MKFKFCFGFGPEPQEVVDALSGPEAAEALSGNPAWKKVQRFSSLQSIFLSISLVFATIYIAFERSQPFLSAAFLATGTLSLIFGGISMKTLREHFFSDSNIAEETREGSHNE